MDSAEKKSYIRLIYREGFRFLGIALFLSALITGLYGERIYFAFALCAFGFVMFCLAWFVHLKAKGMKLFMWWEKVKQKRVPYSLRSDKSKTMHRPAFRRDFTDFDDDLTSQTAVSQDSFTKEQQIKAQILSRAACGLVLILLSFAFYGGTI
ncbi:MAG TPA: hypothetical protein P5116_01525 [Eubacteriales bacterium]|nr:hypothetical protein [Clostridia bacterium]HRV72541.1 hypothetical protein [Eubacteriales bacterium]